VVLTIFIELDPMRSAVAGARFNHLIHSRDVISTKFGRLLWPGTGRSVILT
jgi:hypothetical protein